jgi:hypothetical protein
MISLLIHTDKQDIDEIPHQHSNANRFYFIFSDNDINIILIFFITERNVHKCKLNLLPWLGYRWFHRQVLAEIDIFFVWGSPP